MAETTFVCFICKNITDNKEAHGKLTRSTKGYLTGCCNDLECISTHAELRQECLEIEQALNQTHD